MPPEPDEPPAASPPPGGSRPSDLGRDAIGDRIRIEHMLAAARDAAAFAAGRSRVDLDHDALLRRALIHCVQEIGEAASRMSPIGRARAAGLPWGQIVATRHILVHAYFRVDLNILWDVVGRDLPPLIATLEQAMSGWPPDEA